MSIINKIEKVRNKRKITFENICTEWLVYKKRMVKESSYANYTYSIKKYLIPEFGRFSLRQLEKYDFNEYVEELRQNLSPKTVRDIISNLKAILTLAGDKYDCKIKVKKIISPKQDLEPLAILNHREKNKLERYCLNENSLKSIGIIVCLYTGLRVGEICALRWKDIDLEKRELHVRYTLQRIYKNSEKSTQIIIDKPKTKTSVRAIPISNKIYDLLKELKCQYKDEDFFLTGNPYKFVEPRNYQYNFKLILEASKVKKYKFHILRHTFSTDCIEVGMDIKSLSEILGHSTVEITLNKYVHSSYKTKKKFLEKL